jgi:transketolase
VLRDGEAATLAVCGTLLPYALQAADQLAMQDLNVAVLEFPTIKPFDSGTLLSYAKITGCIVSLEEHTIIGGLGSAIAECLSENHPSRLCRLGIKDRFGQSGDYRGLLDHYELTTKYIVEATLKLLQRRPEDEELKAEVMHA